MNPLLCVLGLVAYTAMMSLIRVFFRPDSQRNARWWLTSVPFMMASHALWLTWFGISPQLLVGGSTLASVLDGVGMLAFVGAIALMAATVATNQVPLALWHQDGALNAPKQIVTFGPYRYVRHPFYVAFLLLNLGSALVARDLLSIAALPLALMTMDWTARGEEKRLLASTLGGEYGAYRARTGRFVPRLLGS